MEEGIITQRNETSIMKTRQQFQQAIIQRKRKRKTQSKQR